MKFRTTLLCGALSVTTSWTTGALAQTAGGTAAGATTIEEVVVTARKREESLQSIPVAVSAISGENLSRQGIRETADLSRTVPSLSINANSSQTPTGAIITLRGQAAADVLLSLSQPVGMYEDSVNIPHPVGTNVAFFDIQRVEVLKGPQGTLYGRNTTGGAINIITRGADYDGVHGFVYGEGGNFSDWKLAGAVNLPIIPDMLAGRLAYQHWNRDGFGKSALTGERYGADRDDDIVRGSLKFDPLPTVSVIGKLEYLHAKRTDGMYQTRTLGESLGTAGPSNPLSGLVGGVAPIDAEWAFEGSKGGVAPSVLVANTHDLFTNYSDLHDFERLSGWHGAIDGSWDITEGLRLRSITGYHQFKDTRVFDLDGLPVLGNHVGIAAGGAPLPSGTAVVLGHSIPLSLADTRPLKPDQTSHQWTQEFNLSGAAFENHFSWLLGAFYSTDEGRANQTAGVLPLLLGALTGPADFNFDELDNTVRTWALFTQNDVKLTDRFSITFGARYTEEKLGQRIADFNYNTSTAAVANRFTCSAGPNKGKGAFATEDACALDQSAKFNGTSYLLSFNFQFTPDTLFYAKTARGFRGGALQVRAPDIPAAGPETATDYEIGLKSDFFDRRLRANLAIYNTNYENKQETIIVADPVTKVTFTPVLNAASARVRGFEGEFTAVPIEDLNLSTSVTYLDSQYVSFPNGLSPLNQTVNATGATFLLPKWTVNVGGRYLVRNVGPGDVGLNANWAWRGKIPTTVLNFNPEMPTAIAESWRQSVGLLNASLEYILPDRGVTFTLFATNLLDKKYQIQSLTLPFGVTGATQEPRMWGVSVRKTFGKE